MLNRRSFLGGIAALVGLGTTRAAVTSQLPEVVIKWRSVDGGANAGITLWIDCMPHLTLYYLGPFGKGKRFWYSVTYYRAERGDYSFATLEEAVASAEQTALLYLSSRCNVSSDNATITFDRGTLFEEMADHIKERDECWERLDMAVKSPEASGGGFLSAIG